MELCYTAAVGACVFLFAEPIMRLFLPEEPAEVISLGVTYLQLISFFYLLSGSGNIIQGFFRGIGDLKVTLISSLLNISVAGNRCVLYTAGISRRLWMPCLGLLLWLDLHEPSGNSAAY